MGKSSNSVPSPNAEIGASANESGALGQQWLSFAQGAYGQEQGLQTNANNVSGTVTNNDLTSGNNLTGFSNTLLNNYEGEIPSLESSYNNAAENYGSTANQESLASQAEAGVAQQAAAANNATNQQLEAEGVNPNSGAFVGINKANDLNTAVAEAGAGTTAATNAVTTGLGLESNAIGLGTASAGLGETAAGQALNANTSATNATNANINEDIAGTNIMNAGYGGALTGTANEASELQNEYNSILQGSEYTNSMNAQESESMWSGIGSLAGLALLSSRTWKTNKRKSSGHLKAVRSMPVERWRYAPGIADGGKHDHVGTYAEDFKKHTGHGDGKTIPVGDAIGITMGAVKELASEVDRVKRAMKAQGPKVPHSKPKGTPRPHVIMAMGIRPPHMRAPHVAHAHAGHPPRNKPFSIRKRKR